VLLDCATAGKLEVDLNWDLMRTFLLKHVDFFGKMVNQWQDLFRRCYALVCTTCFDDGEDGTLMVPFAHCMNHTHFKDTAMFLVNTRMHADPLIDKSYFEGPKFLTDTRIFYKNCKDEELLQRVENNDLIQGF